MKNFGVVLKGSSVARINEVSHMFDDCFIVNNIDRNINNQESEWSIIAPAVKGKNIVHFVNRLQTAALYPLHYKELGIKEVQFSKTGLDKHLSQMKPYYESLDLKTNFLPPELLEYNKFFDDKFYLKPGDSDYSKKHPNTGVLAIIYAAHIIKPEFLWVIGLDFYQTDYLFRRPWQSPLKNQRLKMQNTGMQGHFVDIVGKNPTVKFKLITAADFSGFDLPENLELI